MSTIQNLPVMFKLNVDVYKLAFLYLKHKKEFLL